MDDQNAFQLGHYARDSMKRSVTIRRGARFEDPGVNTHAKEGSETVSLSTKGTSPGHSVLIDSMSLPARLKSQSKLTPCTENRRQGLRSFVVVHLEGSSLEVAMLVAIASASPHRPNSG